MRLIRYAPLWGAVMWLSACAQPTGPAVPPDNAGYGVLQRDILPRPSDAVLLALPRTVPSIEADAVRRLNLKRRAANLPDFQLDSRMVTAARAHSWQMAVHQRGFLVAPGGKGIDARMRDAGVPFGVWAGYAWGPIAAADPYTAAIFALRNLEDRYTLNPALKRIGVGVYRRYNSLYTTVAFAD